MAALLAGLASQRASNLSPIRAIFFATPVISLFRLAGDSPGRNARNRGWGHGHLSLAGTGSSIAQPEWATVRPPSSARGHAAVAARSGIADADGRDDAFLAQPARLPHARLKAMPQKRDKLPP